VKRLKEALGGRNGKGQKQRPSSAERRRAERKRTKKNKSAGRETVEISGSCNGGKGIDRG